MYISRRVEFIPIGERREGFSCLYVCVREREGGCQRGEVTQHGINYQVPERVKSFRNNGAPFLPSSCSLTLTSSLLGESKTRGEGDGAGCVGAMVYRLFYFPFQGGR